MPIHNSFFYFCYFVSFRSPFSPKCVRPSKKKKTYTSYKIEVWNWFAIYVALTKKTLIWDETETHKIYVGKMFCFFPSFTSIFFLQTNDDDQHRSPNKCNGLFSSFKQKTCQWQNRIRWSHISLNKVISRYLITCHLISAVKTYLKWMVVKNHITLLPLLKIRSSKFYSMC